MGRALARVDRRLRRRAHPTIIQAMPRQVVGTSNSRPWIIDAGPPTSTAGTNAMPIAHASGAGHAARLGMVHRPANRASDQTTKAGLNSRARSITGAIMAARTATDARHMAAVRRWPRCIVEDATPSKPTPNRNGPISNKNGGWTPETRIARPLAVQAAPPSNAANPPSSDIPPGLPEASLPILAMTSMMTLVFWWGEARDRNGNHERARRTAGAGRIDVRDQGQHPVIDPPQSTDLGPIQTTARVSTILGYPRPARHHDDTTAPIDARVRQPADDTAP